MTIKPPRRGDSRVLTDRTFSRTQLATDAHMRERMSRNVPPDVGHKAARDLANVARCNFFETAGSVPDVDVGHCLKIQQERLIYESGESQMRLHEFQHNLIIDAKVPTDVEDDFVICLQPNKPGQIALCAIAGVAYAKVNITDVSHKFCKPTVGDSSQMTSGTTGPAKILIARTSPGLADCIIQWPIGASGAKAVDHTFHGDCTFIGTTFAKWDFTNETTPQLDTDLVERVNTTDFAVKKNCIVFVSVEGDRVQNGAIASMEHGFECVGVGTGRGPTYAVITESKGLAFTTGGSIPPGTPWTGCQKWTWTHHYYLDIDTWFFRSALRAYVGTGGGTYVTPDLMDAGKISLTFVECDTNHIL